MVVHASEASQQLAPLSISAQAQQALQQIEAWPHWNLVQQVAQREYQFSTDKMAILLPEYQRFLALIAVCPEGGIGMYSSSVDKLWHSHLLLTRKYRSFCQQMYGRFIDHEPNLPLIAESITLQDCEVPDTPPA